MHEYESLVVLHVQSDIGMHKVTVQESIARISRQIPTMLARL